MATVNSSSVSRTDPATEAQRLELHKYENAIQATIKRTASLLKTTDFFQGCLLLVAWGLAFVLTVVVVDAWVWQLNFVGRFLALAGLVTGGLYVMGRWMAPMILARINPLYAAKVIEDGHPALKNSLVNYVSLTAQEERPLMKKGVMEAVTRRAAIDASRIPREQSIDYSSLIRVMYLLTGVMVVFAAYWMLSPRSPLQSIARLLSPFSDVAAPTRVGIRQIDPPGGSVVVGNTLTVAASISGMLADEKAVIVYDSLDGQAAGATVVMVPQPGTNDRFEGQIKTGEQGVQSSFDFRIVAGDAVSRQYRVLLEQRPTLVLDRVDLKFPAYSELPPQTVIGQGDLRVLEGTEVSVFAHSNVPIKKAWLELYDLPADREVDNDMTQKLIRSVLQLNISDETKAEGVVTATLDVQGKPRYTHYRLLMQDLGERTSRLGPIYKLEVIADQAPEVKWLWPETAEYMLAIDESLDLRFQASDPDFRLSKLTLHVSSRGGRTLVHPVELGEQAGRDVVLGQWQLKPREFGLEPGDEVIAFVQAEDNRHSPPLFQLNANKSRTENLRITIAEPIGIKQDPDDEEAIEAESPPVDPSAAVKADDLNTEPKPNSPEKNAEAAGTENLENLKSEDSRPGESTEKTNEREQDSTKATPIESRPSTKPNPEAQPNQGAPSKQEPSNDDPAQAKPGEKESEEIRQAWKNEPSSQPNDAKHDGDVMEQIRQFIEKEQANPKSAENPNENNPEGNPGGQTDQQQAGQSGQQNQGGQTNQQQAGQSGQQNQAGRQNQGGQTNQQQAGQSGQQNQRGQTGQQQAGQPGQQNQGGQTGQQQAGQSGQQNQGGQTDQQQAGQPGQQNQGGQTGQQQAGQSGQQNQGGQTDQQQAGQPGQQNQGGQTGQQQAGQSSQQNQGGQTDQQQAGQSGQQNQGGQTDQQQAGQSGQQNQGGQTGQQQSGQSGQQNQGGQTDQQQSGQSGQQNQGGQTDQQQSGQSGQQNQGGQTDQQQAGQSGQQNQGGQTGQQQAGQSGQQNQGGQTGQQQSGQSGQQNQVGQTGQQQSGQSGQQSEGGQTDQQSQSGQPGQSQSGQPGQSQSGQPGQSQSGQSGQSQSGQPGQSQSGQPGQSQSGQPGQSQSGQSGQSQSGQSGQSQSGQPGQSQSGQPGQAQSGQPGQSQSGQSGQSQSGQSGQSQSGQSGQSQSGQPGQSQSGQPGQSQSGQPGQSQSGQPGQAQSGQRGQSQSGQSGQPGQAQSGQPGQSQSGQSGQPGQSQPGQSGQSQPGQVGQSQTGQPGQSGQPGQPGQGADRQQAGAGPGSGTPPGGAGEREKDLQFAKETTDMVLQYLNDQENKPNPELLDKLNWTEDDMREFAQRWREMRDRAAAGDETKKEEFHQQLQSLGLRPRGKDTAESTVNKDEMQGLRQDAARATIPFEMMDGFRAFQKAKAKRETRDR